MPIKNSLLIGVFFAGISALFSGCSTGVRAPEPMQLSADLQAIAIPRDSTLELQGTLIKRGTVFLGLSQGVPKPKKKYDTKNLTHTTFYLLFSDENCNGQHELQIVNRVNGTYYHHYFKNKIDWGDEFTLSIFREGAKVFVRLNNEVIELSVNKPIKGAILDNKFSAMKIKNFTIKP